MSEVNGNKEVGGTVSDASVRSTEIDVSRLRRIPGRIPKTALIILLVEVRFRYACLTY
jgi:hypothetical protein